LISRISPESWLPLTTLILPVSSFYLWKNRKAGREEGEKSEYVIPFVLVREVRG
jgi:hypothetical protein